MFEKLVAIEPLNIDQDSDQALTRYAKTVQRYPDISSGNPEIIRRIGDADAVLLSYTSRIDKEVLAACPSIRYIGMCCSLYSPESANVDILEAEKQGVVVKGVRDYGDEGVREYVVSELARFLHGFGNSPMWRSQPTEFTGLPIGILGMGTTGQIVAGALHHFGADIHYYSRTRKPELEQNYTYLPLDQLLSKVDILCTCLNKNVILLHQREFELLGDGKILINISIGPGHDVEALTKWLGRSGNYVFGDTMASIDPTGKVLGHPHAFCAGKSAGMSSMTTIRLGRKVLANMDDFLKQP